MLPVSRWRDKAQERDGWQRLVAGFEFVLVYLLPILWFVILVAGVLKLTKGHLSALLDDAYIHYQYAKMLAKGHFFEYCEGCGFSKGATSILYPVLLAPGWLAGLRGENLHVWALLLGLAGLIGTLKLLVLTAERLGNRYIGLVAAALLVSNTEFVAGCASGMEVGIASFTLALWAYLLVRLLDGEHKVLPWFALVSALAPLVRPELIAASGGATLYVLLSQIAPNRFGGKRSLAWIPIFFVGQAAVMLLFYIKTGSAASNSMLSKSFLYSPGMTLSKLLRITFGEGYSSFFLKVLGGVYKRPYFPPLFVGLFAVGVVAWLTLPKQWRAFGALMLPVLAVGLYIPHLTYSVTWGLYRYCQPFYPWLYFAVAVLAVRLAATRRTLPRLATLVLGAYLLWFAVEYNIPKMYELYTKGCRNIYLQHRRMADYIATHLPKDAIIGINDAGAIPYFSGRRVFDIVGLVTEGMALCFRHGMPCIFETFKYMDPQKRPTHFAIYPAWWKNSFLVGRELYRTRSPDRISVGGYAKHLYEANWTIFDLPDRPIYHPVGCKMVDELDIGSWKQERAHHWRAERRGKKAFTRMVYHEYKYKRFKSRVYPEGGRIIPKGVVESFEVATEPNKPLHIVMRTDAYYGVNVEFWTDANRKPLTLHHKPVRYAWDDIELVLPAEYIKSSPTRVFIKSLGKDYAPFHYWFYQPRN